MKSYITLSVILTALIASLSYSQPALSVVVSNHHGSICEHFLPDEVPVYFNTHIGLISTQSSVDLNIICPLARATTNFLGARAFVHVTHTVFKTTSCNLISISERGDIISSNAGSFLGVGNRTIFIDLRGTGNSAFFSNYSVYCSTQGVGQTILNGIGLVEEWRGPINLLKQLTWCFPVFEPAPYKGKRIKVGFAINKANPA